MKLHLHNPESSFLTAGRRLAVVLGLPGRGDAAEGVDSELEAIGNAGQDLIVQVKGVTTRDHAERLRGARVQVARERDAALEDGQYYYADLIGCRVVEADGTDVGLVHQVFEAGASDVLVVRADGMERYIPLTEPWVSRVDLSRRRIEIPSAEQWESWPVK